MKPPDWCPPRGCLPCRVPCWRGDARKRGAGEKPGGGKLSCRGRAPRSFVTMRARPRRAFARRGRRTRAPLVLNERPPATGRANSARKRRGRKAGCVSGRAAETAKPPGARGRSHRTQAERDKGARSGGEERPRAQRGIRRCTIHARKPGQRNPSRAATLRRVRWPRTRTEMREAGRASRGDRRAATSLRRTTSEADSARYLRACGVPGDGERRRPPPRAATLRRVRPSVVAVCAGCCL